MKPADASTLLIVIIAGLLFAAMNHIPRAHGAEPPQSTNGDPRIDAARTSYIARCTPEMTAQGMPQPRAEAMCGCAFSGIMAEVNLGTPGDRERYERIMRAQPRPTGSPEDRRLHQILNSCLGR